MKIVVLDGFCLNPGDLDWSGLGRFGDVEVFDRTPAEAVVDRARDAQIVLLNKTPMPAHVLRQLPELRYIGVLATGYDVVDAGTAQDMGIVVTNIPIYGTVSVAQFAFALLLELCHKVGMHSQAVREGEWVNSVDWSFTKSRQIELAGKTMGVAGFGRIGRQTARIADAFGMRVIATDPDRRNAPGYPGFEWASLEDLLAESDAVSLHSPLLPQTKGMINAQSLRRMKPSAFLINTARGGLVAARDLADALNCGRIGGAALDVLEVEPPPPDNPLLTAKNCILTPHMAWATLEARARLMNMAVDNVAAFVAGTPRNVVPSVVKS
jgi:glycerate dehydrogenase